MAAAEPEKVGDLPPLDADAAAPGNSASKREDPKQGEQRASDVMQTSSEIADSSDKPVIDEESSPEGVSEKVVDVHPQVSDPSGDSDNSIENETPTVPEEKLTKETTATEVETAPVAEEAPSGNSCEEENDKSPGESEVPGESSPVPDDTVSCDENDEKRFSLNGEEVDAVRPLTSEQWIDHLTRRGVIMTNDQKAALEQYSGNEKRYNLNGEEVDAVRPLTSEQWIDHLAGRGVIMTSNQKVAFEQYANIEKRYSLNGEEVDAVRPLTSEQWIDHLIRRGVILTNDQKVALDQYLASGTATGGTKASPADDGSPEQPQEPDGPSSGGTLVEHSQGAEKVTEAAAADVKEPSSVDEKPEESNVPSSVGTPVEHSQELDKASETEISDVEGPSPSGTPVERPEETELSNEKRCALNSEEVDAVRPLTSEQWMDYIAGRGVILTSSQEVALDQYALDETTVDDAKEPLAADAPPEQPQEANESSSAGACVGQPQEAEVTATESTAKPSTESTTSQEQSVDEELESTPHVELSHESEEVDNTAQLQRLFDLFEKDSAGRVSSDEIIISLRAIGFNPSKAEVTRLIEGSSIGERVDFEQFSSLLRSFVPEKRPDITEALKVFDNSEHMVDLAEFERAMTTQGEPLSQEEYAHLVEQVNASAGGQARIPFDDFVSILKDSSLRQTTSVF